MDNLAHALVGAALGRAVADDRVPAAPWIGAVAANAPDWCEVFVGLPADEATYLVLHRGITHSVAGAAAQVAALTALLRIAWTLHPRGRRRQPPWLWVAALVAATVYSHPLMDWLGSYGLRPWLPWRAGWVYADAVAIVDVFFWFVPLVGLAWGARRHWRSALAPTAAGAILAGAVWTTPIVAGWVKLGVLGVLLLGTVGWLRHWGGVAGRRLAAAASVALLVVYSAAQGLAALPAKAGARTAAHARFGADAQWAALTRIGRPFTWEAVVAGRDSIAGPEWRLARHLDVPVVHWALVETREGRAMRVFARFLAAEVDSAGGAPAIVHLLDARYARDTGEPWGVVSVRVPPGAAPPDAGPARSAAAVR